VKSVKLQKNSNRLFKSGNLNENNQNIKLIIEGSEGFERTKKRGNGVNQICIVNQRTFRVLGS
jgi:hypothetical protein